VWDRSLKLLATRTRWVVVRYESLLLQSQDHKPPRQGYPALQRWLQATCPMHLAPHSHPHHGAASATGLDRHAGTGRRVLEFRGASVRAFYGKRNSGRSRAWLANHSLEVAGLLLQAEPFFVKWFGYSLVNGSSGVGGWGRSKRAMRYVWASNLEPLPDSFFSEWDANRILLQGLPYTPPSSAAP